MLAAIAVCGPGQRSLGRIQLCRGHVGRCWTPSGVYREWAARCTRCRRTLTERDREEGTGPGRGKGKRRGPARRERERLRYSSENLVSVFVDTEVRRCARAGGAKERGRRNPAEAEAPNPPDTHTQRRRTAITINNSILPCVTAGFFFAVEPRALLPSRKSRTTVLPPPHCQHRAAVTSIAREEAPLGPPLSLPLTPRLPPLSRSLSTLSRFNQVTFCAEEPGL